MAGIYIHIPFCRSRCIYCDFCSSTLEREYQHHYIDSLLLEMEARKGWLVGEEISTVYLGGGTPSVLEDADLERVFQGLGRVFPLSRVKEITIEANPDDVTRSRINNWLGVGINRLSMGVQSFDDNLLHLLNRRHSATQAIEAVNAANDEGLSNISIDLMYGLPMLNNDTWQQTVEMALSLPITHLSAYCLSVEEGTPLSIALLKGQLKMPSDEECEKQYKILKQRVSRKGFEHYEISNFSLPDKHSLHNSSYWDETPYIGLGAGAHSYNGTSRRANTDDVKEYISGKGNPPFEEETLSLTDKINETLFTRLRTSTGINIKRFQSAYGMDRSEQILNQASKHCANGLMVLENGHLKLTEKGVFISNDLISDLMFVD